MENRHQNQPFAGPPPRDAARIFAYNQVTNLKYMSKVEVRPINHERMNRWKDRLNENESTPVILVGVGHNKVRGRLFVLCTEDRTDEEVILFLKAALAQLQGFTD